MMNESFKISNESSVANNIRNSTTPLTSSNITPKFNMNQFRFPQKEETAYENHFQSIIYNCLERFLQNYIESAALLKYDEIMNKQIYSKQAVDHLRYQLITQMNSMFKLKNDPNTQLEEFNKYRMISITIIQNLCDVPILLKELVDLFLGEINSMEIMKNPIPLYPIKQQNIFNISILGDLKRNQIQEKIKLQMNQLIQQLYFLNLNDQLHIIKALKNLISNETIEEGINEELAETEIKQLKCIFPEIEPILSSLEKEIVQKTMTPLNLNSNDYELIQLILDKCLYKKNSMINYQHQSQQLKSFLMILFTYLENLDNISIKQQIIKDQQKIENKQGLAEIQNYIISTRLITFFQKLQQQDSLRMEDMEIKYCLSIDLQTISKFATHVIIQDDQEQLLSQEQQQTKLNQKRDSIVVVQSSLNQSIIQTEKQGTSKLNWNDNQIKRLMYDDFKQLLTQVYKFQPFQSFVNENAYAKFYLNELYISFNLSNNLYYFLNKKQYNLSQNKKELLELLNEIKQSGYQFEGVIKEILEQYGGNHLSENGFKRHLYGLVKIPEDAQLNIEVDLKQRYSSEVTKNGGLFVVEDKPLSQTSSEQLKELLFKVRTQSLQKVKAIDEDKIFNQMKEECYKSISIVDQTEFIFLLKALKKNQVEEAKKYYKPTYKDTLQQFQNCENEKIKQALTVILSQNDFKS